MGGMCVDADAQPPIESTGEADHGPIILEAEDGTRFSAYEASSRKGPTPAAVIVLPDIRGLFPFYEQLAVRFAEAEHDADAIDYVGRTDGTDERRADIDPNAPLAQ